MKKSYLYNSGLAAIGFSLALTIPVLAKGEDVASRSMGEEHRSNVADVVKELTALAGKDRNIGQEIKVVAQEQKMASEQAAEAMNKVQAKGGWNQFLFGTDYKNLGVLRSTLVTTSNHISRLEKAMEKSKDPAVKADLQVQIDELKAEQAKVTLFIKEHEDKFSVLGWFVKMFAE
jgi:hypothetical protein